MSGKRFNAFGFRNWCASFHSGQDDSLGDLRQGILHLHGCCCCQKRADSRHNFVRNPQCVQRIQLFPNGTVNGWVACMNAHGGFSGSFRLLHYVEHFLQCHASAVVHLCLWFPVLKHRRIHQRACVNNHVCVVNQPFPLDGQKFRIACPCTNKIYHTYFLLC